MNIRKHKNSLHPESKAAVLLCFGKINITVRPFDSAQGRVSVIVVLFFRLIYGKYEVAASL